MFKPHLYAPNGPLADFNAVKMLFANSEQGALYHFQDWESSGVLYQDSAKTTLVTAVGDPVGAVVDRSGNGNDATQSVSASRPTLQQDANGRYYLKPDGTDDYFTISGSASTFKFMHDGTGGLLATAAAFGVASDPNALYPLASSNGLTTSNIGFAFYYDDRTASGFNDRLQLQVTKGSAGNSVLGFGANEGAVAQTATALRAQYATGSGEDGHIYKGGALLASGAELNTPSTASSSADVRLFNAGSFFMAGRFYGGLFRAGIPSAAVLAQVDRFFARQGGISL